MRINVFENNAMIGSLITDTPKDSPIALAEEITDMLQHTLSEALAGKHEITVESLEYRQTMHLLCGQRVSVEAYNGDELLNTTIQMDEG